MALTIFPMAEKVSEILGVPAKTGREYARKLRNAGLITSGGRGPSAAVMNKQDYTNFILGIMASNTATHAAEAVQNIRECRYLDHSVGADSNPGPIPFEFMWKDQEELASFAIIFESLLDKLAKKERIIDDEDDEAVFIYTEVFRPGNYIEIILYVSGWPWKIKFENGRGLGEVSEMLLKSSITKMTLQRIAALMR